MTLVIEESEDISPELLTVLLASVKRNSEVNFPGIYFNTYLFYFAHF